MVSPLSHDGKSGSKVAPKNHKGATDFPEADGKNVTQGGGPNTLRSVPLRYLTFW